MVKIQIDEKELTVADNISVLEAALQNNIYIPHLCHHPDLPELASCRLCIVEASGYKDVVPSCTLKVTEGLKISTKSEKIDRLRRLALELLLAPHPEDCSTCPKYGRCELQTLIQYMGISSARVRHRTKGLPMKTDNPLFIHDMNRCVLCGRCVRACNDLRGVKVLQYNKRELETYIGTVGDKLLKDADCRFCGACAEVCPTGAIRDAQNYNAAEKRDVLVPCKATCPVHTDVPRYVRYVNQGKYAEAVAVIHERLPFPECLGFVCNHPCELQCRRKEVNEAISIREIKRFAAENDDLFLWQKNSKQLPPTGKKVCVIGGGPSGMTAAFYLAKQGHEVTLKEAMPKLGGQLQYGIPAYRLPREVVDRETAYIIEAGVKVETNNRVDKPLDLLGSFDALLMAIGTHQGIRLPLPGNTLKGVMVSTDFLRQAALGKETGIGSKVVVLGGGNVAFDCARTALRLGAVKVAVACLEPREQMLAEEEEIEQAIEEGVLIYPASSFEEIVGTNKAEGVSLARVKSFHFDENMAAVIEKEPDSEYVIEADTVIFAVGQRPQINSEAGIPLGKKNSIMVRGEHTAKTNITGLFACGDAVYGTKTVAEAVAAGRLAASEIDLFLGGDGDISETLVSPQQLEAKIGVIKGFAYLEREKPEILPAEQRKNNFEVLNKGLSSDKAYCESRRCLQCDLRLEISPNRLWSDYRSVEREATK